MYGKTNLSEVLKTLQVSCDNIEYGFGIVKDNHISFNIQAVDSLSLLKNNLML